MTHLSKKGLGNKEHAIFDELLGHLLKGLDEKGVKSFASTLLTKTEKVMLQKRAAIIHLLKEGYSVDEISKLTKTTRQTISRIKLQLLEVQKDNLNYFHKKISKWNNMKKLKTLITEISAMKTSKKVFGRKSH